MLPNFEGHTLNTLKGDNIAIFLSSLGLLNNLPKLCFFPMPSSPFRLLKWTEKKVLGFSFPPLYSSPKKNWREWVTILVGKENKSCLPNCIELMIRYYPHTPNNNTCERIETYYCCYGDQKEREESRCCYLLLLVLGKKSSKKRPEMHFV